MYFAPLLGLVLQRDSVGLMRRRTLLALFSGLILVLTLVGGVNAAYFPTKTTWLDVWDLAFPWGSACGIFFLLFWLRRYSMPRFACWMGRVSYSAYLLHPFVLVLLPASLPVGIFLLGLGLGTFALAELSYRFVEKPGIALGKSMEGRRWEAKVLGRLSQGA